MKKNVTSTVLQFKDIRGRKGRCRIEIFEQHPWTVVLVTDLNTGPSVTNAAEEIATAICEKYPLLNIDRTVWVEHYEKIQGWRKLDTFDLVRFTWHGRCAADPEWQASCREQVEDLIGGVLCEYQTSHC